MFTTAGAGVREQAARILTDQLRRAGVEVDARFLPSGPLFQQISRNGDFDVALSIQSDYVRRRGQGHDASLREATSRTGYCQRLVDRDLDEASRMLDADQRAVVLNRIDARVALDVPMLPLFYHP